MFVFIYGSSMILIFCLSGIFDGLSMYIISPFVWVILYITDGLVAIMSILNSLSILSSIISMWSRPRKPHLNPNPNASEVSGWNSKAASFSFNFSKASLKSWYLFVSTGYNPQKTIGFIGLYPGSFSSAGLFSRVIVSPTLMSLMLLILPHMYPTSPHVNFSFIFSFGVYIPSSVTSWTLFVAISFILSFVFISPLIILTKATTPLYGSKWLSKTKAFSLPCFSSFGDGILSIIASINSFIPSPVLALVKSISSSSNPRVSMSSFFTFGTSAFGRSILLITGIIVKSFSKAKYILASVWASIPWAASTTRTAPSQAARHLETSYEKSTCPGVSIKCII